MTTVDAVNHAPATRSGTNPGALEIVVFLARSEHRVHVLSLLSTGERSQDEISEAVAASRVTLSRILHDFEERGLITHRPSDDAYAVTRYGELVNQDFDRLLRMVVVGQTDLVAEGRPADWTLADLRELTTHDSVVDERDEVLPAPHGVPRAALETVAFLARSEHRLRVLSLLRDGDQAREDLSRETEVTRVTLSRILSNLEDWDLITRRTPERKYALTRFGEIANQGFTRLLNTVSIGRIGADVLDRLPVEWFDFDLRCLATAELITGSGDDPMAAARVVASSVQNASTRHALLGTFLSTPFHTFEDALRADDEPDGAVIFDAGVTETITTDPTLSDRWQQIEVMADATVYYSVDANLPCGIAVHDGEQVFLTVDREADNGFDVLRSTHPDVVDWVERTIRDWQTEAVPLRARIDD